MDSNSPVDPGWYTPKTEREKPEAEQVRFKIRGLIGTEVMDVNFVQDDLGGGISMTARGGNACLKNGLLGWNEHFKDAKTGDACAWDEQNWRRNMERIRPELTIEIALEIWNRTFLSKDQEKN